MGVATLTAARADARASENAGRAVTAWLFTVAALVALMVIVGGYVRLTRSGLSIVEWNPVGGVIPPIGEAAWQAEFAKYQQTPEFKLINSTMTLDGYKRIFFLEWAHRLIARVAGLIVALPLLFFLWKGMIPWRKSAPYLAIGALFAFQGFMGWYMVASGLVERPHVSHFRLTIHLLTALSLLGLTLWVALGRIYPASERARPQWSAAGLAVLAIIVLQIGYGGLVAGLKAGWVSNTWPLMLGALIPPGLLTALGSWLESLLEAPLTTHFVHRWLAFGVLGAAAWFYLRQRGGTDPGAHQIRVSAAALVGVILLQILLGISVVLFSVPVWLALLHQAVALLMFATAIYLNHRLRWAERG
ncbi:MAG: COX15/CtaA family protein [Anaerolineae bacterium]|nr:COX15/CtaA family protein [Anaerolineae bacterium]